MSLPYRVLICDFLEETRIEAPVFDGLAEIVLARASAESQLSDLLPTSDALIIYHDIPHIGEASFSRAERCIGVVRAGVGFNNVDIDAAAKRGIVVCNVPDYGTEEVADHAMMMLLALARRMRPADEAIRRGIWDFHTVIDAPRLRGKTLGLIGCGRIGTAMALRAKAFGLDVVFFDPHVSPGLDKAIGIRRADSMEALMKQSLFVSLHCFLDAKSRHLINAETLSLMPRGGFLINTARGGVVDGDALLAALDSGQLLGAGLDVVEKEPLDDDRIRHHPSVLLSPHSAFFSIEGFVELRQKTAEEARRLLLGQPPRCPVNLAKVERARTPRGRS